MSDSFEAAIDRMEASGGGLYSLLLLDGVNAVPMIAAAAAGDRTAIAYVGCIREFLQQCRSAPKKHAPLCLCCPRELYRRHMPRVISVAVPAGPNPGDAMVCGLCRHCVAQADWPRPGWQQRLAEIMQAILAELWAGVKILDPAHFSAGASGTA
jgi:hypothetical protein